MGDAPVETPHHPIRLWVFGRDQPMPNAKTSTHLVKPMVSGGFALTLGGKPVGELLAIIGQDSRDSEGAFFV